MPLVAEDKPVVTLSFPVNAFDEEGVLRSVPGLEHPKTEQHVSVGRKRRRRL